MRFWLTVSILLVLLAGIAVGYGLANKGAGKPSAPLPVSELDDAFPYLLTGGVVYEELSLNPEQLQAIDSLLASYHRQAKEVLDERQRISDELREGVSSLLDEPQRQRLIEIRERYRERELHFLVVRELSRLRPELSLEQDQESRLYQPMFDYLLNRRGLFREHSKTDRESLREKGLQLRTLRDAAFQEILSAPQYEKFGELQEREKRMWEKRRRGRRGGGDKPPRRSREGGEDKPERGPEGGRRAGEDAAGVFQRPPIRCPERPGRIALRPSITSLYLAP